MNGELIYFSKKKTEKRSCQMLLMDSNKAKWHIKKEFKVKVLGLFGCGGLEGEIQHEKF